MRLQCKTDDELALAPLWLQRSRDAIIDVDICGEFQNHAQLGSVLIELLSNQSRLRKLSLSQVELEAFRPMAVNDLSNLVELSLTTKLDTDYYYSSRPDMVLPYTFLLPRISQQPVAPRLRKLDLTSYFTTKQMQIEIWALLEQCPNLEELSLNVINYDDDTEHEPDGHAFVLGKLESIVLESRIESKSDRQFLMRLLRRLEAPSLLSLTVRTYMDDWFAEAIQEFLVRSHYGGPVRKAEIRSIGCEGEFLEEILEALPGVTELCTHAYGSTIYELLTLGQDTDDLCPLLESFHANNLFEEASDDMADFLVSRLSRARTFKASIRVDHMSRDDREWIYNHPYLQQWMSAYDYESLVWTNEDYEGLERPFEGPFDVYKQIAEFGDLFM